MSNATPRRTNVDAPTVAIIIPCHNHGHLITEAVQSVLQQDYGHLMLSIVDDGSTDDSCAVIRGMMNEITQNYLQDDDGVYVGTCQGLPMVFVHRPEARKQAAARNTAIKTCWENADLFCQLDADDLYLPGKISKSVAAWQTDPNYIGLVYSDAIIHDIRDDTNVREYRPPYDRTHLEKENIISNAPLISKMALGYSGLYDEALPPCEDWDLWLRITENFAAVHIPEALQQYTVTGENCTFTVPSEVWQQQWQRVQMKLHERKRLRHG